jgi:hypothetical protein
VTWKAISLPLNTPSVGVPTTSHNPEVKKSAALEKRNYRVGNLKIDNNKVCIFNAKLVEE